jgi:hypothetical protein
MILPDRPSQDQLTSYFESQKAKVRGRIVMAGKFTAIPVDLNPPAKRLTDEQAQQRFGPKRATGRRISAAVADADTAPGTPRPLTNRQIDEQLDAFLKSQRRVDSRQRCSLCVSTDSRLQQPHV